ncbi:MAG: hypothetical protein ACE5E7_11895 [Anaerolineae bacterium]
MAKISLKRLTDGQVLGLAHSLFDWLLQDMGENRPGTEVFTDSRARALLRSTDLVDGPTLKSFMQLMERETALRVGLADLLETSGLDEHEGAQGLAVAAAQIPPVGNRGPIPWTALAAAAFAWKNGYPVSQLDPASPPGTYTPAGQLLRRTAQFIRRQVQRTATERGKLGRKLAYDPDAVVAGPIPLEALPPSEPVIPLPPHFRPPVPVRYPEVLRETLRVDPAEGHAPVPVFQGDPITITNNDLPPASSAPMRMPPIHIESGQTAAGSRPATTAVMSGFTEAIRRKFGRHRERLATTKLRIIAQEYPDGPGLLGLQVRVTCKGIHSHVAGTTNRDGRFLCELPVRVDSGLTYDVDVTWPRDLGGETERKSITLNADRTEFTLPFFQKQRPDG